jgi:hypothetical protein
MIKAISGIFVGGRATCSMGRVAFWLAFLLALYRWVIGQDIPPGHLSVLVAIMGYVFGSKFIGKKHKNKSQDDDPEESLPE